MSTGDDLPQHLEFIQAIIARLSHHSFFIKGWSLSIIAAVFLLLDGGMKKEHAMVAAIVPVLLFWALDGWYLMRERMYRDLHDDVRFGRVPATAGRFLLKAAKGTWIDWFAACGGVNALFYGAVLAAATLGLWLF